MGDEAGQEHRDALIFRPNEYPSAFIALLVGVEEGRTGGEGWVSCIRGEAVGM